MGQGRVETEKKIKILQTSKYLYHFLNSIQKRIWKNNKYICLFCES